jgi:putative transposase
MPVEMRRALVECPHPVLSVQQQCGLLSLPRSTYYYASVRDEAEDLALMRLLDEQYTRRPFYGVRRMTQWLQEQGWPVGLKRVRRLLRVMGLDAIYPKPRLSVAAPGHRIYPYLLRDLAIVHPNQVWSTDITYIRMARGFVYLTAIMDWFSRYVLAWRLSITLETDFCVEALDEALRCYGAPEIFNSDQGSQFTSEAFTGRLLAEGVRISMDGRGRAFDNIFIERLWRSVKYEEVYLHDYPSVPEARESLGAYFAFYNAERPHQALGNVTPWQCHCAGSLS